MLNNNTPCNLKYEVRQLDRLVVDQYNTSQPDLGKEVANNAAECIVWLKRMSTCVSLVGIQPHSGHTLKDPQISKTFHKAYDPCIYDRSCINNQSVHFT